MSEPNALDGKRERQCSLINRSQVKAKALEIAGVMRAQGWTRVGKSFLDRIESRTRAAIAEEVRIHPSKGKTLL